MGTLKHQPEDARGHLVAKFREIDMFARGWVWATQDDIQPDVHADPDLFYVANETGDLLQFRYAGRISEASDWTLEQLIAHIENVLKEDA